MGLTPTIDNAEDLGPDSQKVASLSQVSAEILLISEILVSAEIQVEIHKRDLS